MNTSVFYLKRDLFIYRLLLAQVPILAISGLVGEGLLAFSIGSAVLIGLVSSLCYALLKGTSAFGVIAAIVMMSVSALLIQSQFGMIEMHFHIFASIVVFLVYERWQPIVAGLLTVAVHHILFTYLQLNDVSIMGMPLLVFAGTCSWEVTFVHALFAGAESLILIYMAIRMGVESGANRRIAQVIHDVSVSNNLAYRIVDPKEESERALNGMLDKLASVFSDYLRIAEQLSSTAERLRSLSVEVSQSSDSQSQSTNHMVQETRNIMGLVEQTTSRSAQASQSANEVKQTSQTDSDQAKAVVQDMQRLESDTVTAASSLQELTNEVNSITTALDSIRSISEQTNLLALNAAIEAARAGESGRGFAVVADEVRTLAQRSSDSTDEIEQVLERLNQSMTRAVQAMDSGRSRTLENVTKVQSIADGLHQRSAQVSQVSELSHSLAASLEEQRNSLVTIEQNLEVNAEGLHVLAGRIQEVDHHAQTLAVIAEDYQTKAQAFKV